MAKAIQYQRKTKANRRNASVKPKTRRVKKTRLQ